MGGEDAGVAAAVLTTTPQGQAADGALVKWLVARQKEVSWKVFPLAEAAEPPLPPLPDMAT